MWMQNGSIQFHTYLPIQIFVNLYITKPISETMFRQCSPLSSSTLKFVCSHWFTRIDITFPYSCYGYYFVHIFNALKLLRMLSQIFSISWDFSPIYSFHIRNSTFFLRFIQPKEILLHTAIQEMLQKKIWPESFESHERILCVRMESIKDQRTGLCSSSSNLHNVFIYKNVDARVTVAFRKIFHHFGFRRIKWHSIIKKINLTILILLYACKLV